MEFQFFLLNYKELQHQYFIETISLLRVIGGNKPTLFTDFLSLCCLNGIQWVVPYGTVRMVV